MFDRREADRLQFFVCVEWDGLLQHRWQVATVDQNLFRFSRETFISLICVRSTGLL